MFPPAFLQDAPPKLVIGKIQNELKMGTSSFCINRSLAEQQQKTVPIHKEIQPVWISFSGYPSLENIKNIKK